jgi:hypothetical protein
MKTRISTIAALMLIGLCAASAAHAQATCVGDCMDDGAVSISDLVTGVNIALNTLPITACPSFACEGGTEVPVNCLVQGVNHALNDDCSTMPPQVRTFSVFAGVLAGPGDGTCMTGNPTPCIQNADCPSADCSASSTGLFTSALSNTNAAAQFSSGPFKLVLGPEGANGVHPLSLQEDAVFTIDIVNSTCLCLKFRAAGSMGSVDCDGGTPYDTSITQPSGPGTAWTFQTGLGNPSGPGDGNLIVMGLFQQVMDFCSNVNCADDAVYHDPPNTFPFTTTKTTAFKGAALNQSDHGAPFDCANFTTSGSGGILNSGVAQTIDPVGDTANVLRFAENP